MASIIVRQIPESLKVQLKRRAARHGRSMEEEARAILKSALSTKEEPSENLGERIHRRFAAAGGFKMPDLPREPAREPPDFR